MRLLGLAVLVVLLQTATAQDANCDFTQNVQVGQTYYITNPGYPNNYTGARQCRWIGIAPTNYVNVLDCPEIILPPSQGCSSDRLLISRSGDPQLSGAAVYCGRGSTTTTSSGQRISVGLITPSTTPGGRFRCQLRAQTAAPAPSQCSCGYKKNNRIVGGQETGINEYPMMAGVVDVRIYQIKCGATIIDKRYVLTAAHCVVERTISELAVVVGEHDVNIGDTPATQGFSVQRITRHPQYNSATYDYDIALLRLNGDITFSDRVGPACLPFKFVDTDFTGKKVTFLGWGTTGFGEMTSDTLRKVDVSVLSQNSCRSVISTLTPRQFCTYTEGKDACQDDSGGPALYTDPATGLLFSIGVISYGRACAQRDSPGINTRVTELLPWVLANTPDVQYCQK